MDRIRLDPDDNALRRAALALFTARDWEGLAGLIRSRPPQTAYVTLRLLSESAPIETDLTELIARGSPFDLTIAGALLYGRAMRFRGLDTADNVSDEQWALYLPAIETAQQLLAEANGRSPSLGLTAAWLVTAFVDATDDEKDEAESALRKAVDVPVSGLARIVTLRSKKWGGSHERMWRAARHFAQADPPASLALIAKAHFEQWLWLDAFDESPAGAASAERYFEDDAVAAEMADASARVLAGDDARDPRSLLFADNAFAAASRAGWPARQARPHLKRIGTHVDPSLWLFSWPMIELNRARLAAWLPPVW